MQGLGSRYTLSLSHTCLAVAMPLLCHFNISKQDLETFRHDSWFTSWESCWETVSDSLDLAEARACENGDVDVARQVLRLNKLIQTCLEPNWEVASQDASPDRTILCSLEDWTDQWSRYKQSLGFYHMEEISDAAADLKRLQENLTLLPAASWAHEAERQVSLLLVDLWAVRQYRP